MIFNVPEIKKKPVTPRKNFLISKAIVMSAVISWYYSMIIFTLILSHRLLEAEHITWHQQNRWVSKSSLALVVGHANINETGLLSSLLHLQRSWESVYINAVGKALGICHWTRKDTMRRGEIGEERKDCESKRGDREKWGGRNRRTKAGVRGGDGKENKGKKICIKMP